MSCIGLISKQKCTSSTCVFSSRQRPIVRRSIARSSINEDASRRDIMIGFGFASSSLILASPAHAGFTKELKKKKLTEGDYIQSDATGLKIYDLSEGTAGPKAKAGDKVIVHFDVMYKGIDVVSSRSARLLGANRTIAEPYEFIVGQEVSGQPVKKISEGAGGLFAGTGGPKPPPALSTSVIGMKKGAKRSILVDNPDLGYGKKGIQELPPNATFELKVEILEIIPKV